MIGRYWSEMVKRDDSIDENGLRTGHRSLLGCEPFAEVAEPVKFNVPEISPSDCKGEGKEAVRSGNEFKRRRVHLSKTIRLFTSWIGHRMRLTIFIF